MSRFMARGVLFHTLVLLFFSQHAIAQQIPCSAPELATHNLETQRALACVQELGPNGLFSCMQMMAARLNGVVSPTCLAWLNDHAQPPPPPINGNDDAMRDCLKRCTGLPRNVPCRC
jgi:hypothetical protein